MLKTVVLLDIFGVKIRYSFQDSSINRKFKRTAFIVLTEPNKIMNLYLCILLGQSFSCIIYYIM